VSLRHSTKSRLRNYATLSSGRICNTYGGLSFSLCATYLGFCLGRCLWSMVSEDMSRFRLVHRIMSGGSSFISTAASQSFVMVICSYYYIRCCLLVPFILDIFAAEFDESCYEVLDRNSVLYRIVWRLVLVYCFGHTNCNLVTHVHLIHLT
jgi:hypothetical protein